MIVAMAEDPGDATLDDLRNAGARIADDEDAATTSLTEGTTHDDMPERVGRHDFVVLMGHGRADAFVGTRSGPVLLDQDTAGWTVGRWIHLVACECGQQLVPALVDAGAEGASGYKQRLILDLKAMDVPEELRVLVDELCSKTVRLMAGGERDQRTIQQRLDRWAIETDPLFKQYPEYEILVGATVSGFVRSFTLAASNH